MRRIVHADLGNSSARGYPVVAASNDWVGKRRGRLLGRRRHGSRHRRRATATRRVRLSRRVRRMVKLINPWRKYVRVSGAGGQTVASDPANEQSLGIMNLPIRRWPSISSFVSQREAWPSVRANIPTAGPTDAGRKRSKAKHVERKHAVYVNLKRPRAHEGGKWSRCSTSTRGGEKLRRGGHRARRLLLLRGRRTAPPIAARRISWTDFAAKMGRARIRSGTDPVR
jgi:hypothetical protein